MARLTPKHVLEVYLSWKGRIGRGEFWAYGVALNIVWMLVAALLTMAPSPGAEFASLAWYVVLLVFYSGLMVKRGHDRGRPALFSVAVIAIRACIFFAVGMGGGSAWLSVVGVALILYVLVDYAIMPGQKSTNRYGPPAYSGALNRNPLVLGAEPEGGPALSSETPKA